MQVPESVGAAFTGYENINEIGKVTFQKKVFGNHEGIVSKDAWLSRVGVGNPLQMPAVVVRRSTYERLGGFHPNLVFTSDWELWKRIATFCDWWYFPDVLAHYRQHCESKTADLSKTGAQVTSIRQAIEVSATYFPENISADITAQSRRHYFQYCLYEIALLLQKGDLSVALHLLKEALKIDTSSKSIHSLFNLLSQEAALPLRQAILQQFSSENQVLCEQLADLLGDALSKLALTMESYKPNQKAVDLQPNDTNAHYNRGLVFKKQGQLNKFGIKYDSPLIITGMHRSGTSLMASLFQSAGLNIGKNLLKAYKGNSKGHFENLDFFNFHRSVLHSQGINPDGWTLKDKILLNPNQVQEAIGILEKNAISEFWGWKDPRTTLFLNFWYSLLPQAYFIFIYRHPLEVVDSLYRRNSDPIFNNKPNLAIEMWLHYNQKIVDFCNLNSDKCLLININQINLASERAILIQMINSKFKLKLNDIDYSIYEPKLLKRQTDNTIRENSWKISDEYTEIAAKLYHNLNLINDKLKS